MSREPVPVAGGVPSNHPIALTPLDPAEAVGFAIAIGPGAPYRGSGGADFVCGRCGLLLAAGVRRAFRSLVLACACGELNAFPR